MLMLMRFRQKLTLTKSTYEKNVGEVKSISQIANVRGQEGRREGGGGVKKINTKGYVYADIIVVSQCINQGFCVLHFIFTSG